MDEERSCVGVAEMELMTERQASEKTRKQVGDKREQRRWGDTEK